MLSATINRYVHGSLEPREDDIVRVESGDLGISVDFADDKSLTFDGRLDLFKAAIRKLGRGGYDIFLRSEAPPGSGLGSSSAVMVALIGLLKDYHRLALDDYEIAHMAWQLEREELGIRGGLQDQYAAAFGGFNFIEMGADQVVVNPLRIKPDVVHELEHNMLLAFTGRTRSGDHIIEDQSARLAEHDSEALAGLRMQKELAVSMKNALLSGKLNEFGALLGHAWEYKQKMSPKISTPYIAEAYSAAIGAGALGGKVTGAGGGGFMLFYCPFRKKHRVAAELEKLGISITEFGFTHHGLRTWTAHG
ncbi:MAG: GHMP kinase [Solirubrobacteraceae bacterium]|nr:GHMP kinase [Solirubrobacteraceae bacterium]